MELTRRQMLVRVGAVGAGVAAGVVPELLLESEDEKKAKGKRGAGGAKGPRDPGYAHGPLTATQRPVHTLHDLMPAAPRNAVALTIDDGPHPRWTPMMLDVLAEFGVKATFSLIGVQVTEFPALVRRIVADGHQVADHTVNHPLNLPSLSTQKIKEEIVGGHDRIAQIGGLAPRLFRAPGGNWSPQVLDTAAGHGMLCIDWEVDPRDWARPGTARIATTMSRAQAGDILLCHDGGGDRAETIQALRQVLPTLKARGLTFVAL